MTHIKLNTRGLKLVADFSKFNQLAAQFYDENEIPLTDQGRIAHRLLQSTDPEDEFKFTEAAIKNMDANDILELLNYITQT